MIRTVRVLFKKYREEIAYLFFGGLTTLVNFAAYFALTRLLGAGVGTATALAWAAAVAFAYATNRTWVFQSRASGAAAVLRELRDFVAARVLTGVLEWLLMLLTVDFLGWSDWLMKPLLTIFTILLNYFLSKFFIFRAPKG